MLGSGIARGAHARGKRIAFGDGRRILWSHTGEEIYRGNPNVAKPGSEGASDLEWVAHYKHHRIYFDYNNKIPHGNNWVFDPNFRAQPGEIYFDGGERAFASKIKSGFVLIEPTVKAVYPNKQWPVERYANVAKQLLRSGYQVCQFMSDAYHSGPLLYPGVKSITSRTFRHALAALSRASLFIGPEGGLAHGAAALRVRAVVLFGGFTDPKIFGYAGNVNLTGGASPCGSLGRCTHCKEAMLNIASDEVYHNAIGLLK